MGGYPWSASSSSFTSRTMVNEGREAMKKIEKVMTSLLFAIASSGGNSKIH
jgi:hypothetical protein